jgi:hypothetical protein
MSAIPLKEYKKLQMFENKFLLPKKDEASE